MPVPRREVAVVPRRPGRGFYHCFGCGEGGDVFAFLMKIDGLGFSEAVERLADKFGVTLRREEGDVRDDRPRGPAAGPAARGQQGRPGVLRRRSSARPTRWPRASSSASGASTRPRPRTFGIGFAPRDGEALVRHLRQTGFTDEETVAAGLVAIGRGRRTTGSAAGCCGRSATPAATPSGSAPAGSSTTTGSRRSTSTPPRPPIYKKSQVLYGIDLARRDMARTSQAVVVEGYTDVMACHLVRRRRPRSRPAARRSATTTRGCCGGSCTTTRSSAAR